MRSPDTDLQNTTELRATAWKSAAPKPDLGTKAKKNTILNFEALFKRNVKRKITSAQIGKICWQITMAALMQPPQYDLQCPAVAFTHAAAAPSNLDAAITIRSAKTESDWVAKHKKNTAAPIREWSRHSRRRPGPARRTRFPSIFRAPKAKVEDVKTKLSCETSHKISELKMWKRSFWCWDSGDSVIVVIVW